MLIPVIVAAALALFFGLCVYWVSREVKSYE